MIQLETVYLKNNIIGTNSVVSITITTLKDFNKQSIKSFFYHVQATITKSVLLFILTDCGHITGKFLNNIT